MRSFSPWKGMGSLGVLWGAAGTGEAQVFAKEMTHRVKVKSSAANFGERKYEQWKE